MASLGAKVLQTRSVELAMAKQVPVRVLSSFIEPDENGALPHEAGTLICDEEEIVEKRIVSGVTMSRDEARITLLGLSDRVDAPADVFTRLAEANVNVDMIVQSQARTAGTVNLTFTTGRRDALRAADIMKAAQADHVQGPGGQGGQVPGHLDLRDQDQRPDRRRLRRTGRSRPAFGLWAGRAIGDLNRAPTSQERAREG